MKIGELKRETESLAFASYERVFRKNSVKYAVDHYEASPIRRFCKEKVKSIPTSSVGVLS